MCTMTLQYEACGEVRSSWTSFLGNLREPLLRFRTGCMGLSTPGPPNFSGWIWNVSNILRATADLPQRHHSAHFRFTQR